MKPTAISAQYVLKLSTGNYGSEEVGMSISAELQDGADVTGELGALVEHCRRLVRGELALSEFPAVRRAVAPRPEVEDAPESPF